VQVAAVTGSAEAERTRKELAQSYSTDVVRADSMFKVRVGPYPTKKEADAVAARLKRQRKFRDAWVTSK
jgi:cell division protein FtsN